jgi:hypothetical protein
MDKANILLKKILLWLLLSMFVLFYPMLISIYVFLPLFVGVVGYFLILGIDRGKISYILISLFYLINLDINLSLPFLLSTIAVLLVYIFLYPYIANFKSCKVCSPLLNVLFIDLIYFLLLMGYDFIFQTHNIMLDDILLYPLVIDLLVAVVI